MNMGYVGYQDYYNLAMFYRDMKKKGYLVSRGFVGGRNVDMGEEEKEEKEEKEVLWLFVVANVAVRLVNIDIGNIE